MRRNTLYIIVGGAAVFLVTLVAMVVVLVLDAIGEGDEVAQSLEAIAAGDDVEAEEDPFAGRQADAVRIVRAHPLDLGNAQIRVRDRISEELLQAHLHVLAYDTLDEPQWTAARVEDTTIYQVKLRYLLEGLAFGPRWYVQVDPDGPRPEGSGGVLAMNALALFLESEEPERLARYYNRDAEVVEALTNHRFEGGLRLASALLSYFGRRVHDIDVKGWVVVPERVSPDEELLFIAYFLWNEDGDAREAAWEVDLMDGTFLPANLQAYQIMRIIRGFQSEDIQPLRLPRLGGTEIDLDTDPSREREEDLRAFRMLLADDRRREAVATLLEVQRREQDVEYVNWRLSSVEGRGNWKIQYNYLLAGEPMAIAWVVNARTGTVTAEDEVSALAERALRPRPRSDDSP